MSCSGHRICSQDPVDQLRSSTSVKSGMGRRIRSKHIWCSHHNWCLRYKYTSNIDDWAVVRCSCPHCSKDCCWSMNEMMHLKLRNRRSMIHVGVLLCVMGGHGEKQIDWIREGVWEKNTCMSFSHPLFSHTGSTFQVHEILCTFLCSFCYDYRRRRRREKRAFPGKNERKRTPVTPVGHILLLISLFATVWYISLVSLLLFASLRTRITKQGYSFHEMTLKCKQNKGKGVKE